MDLVKNRTGNWEIVEFDEHTKECSKLRKQVQLLAWSYGTESNHKGGGGGGEGKELMIRNCPL